MNWDAHVKGHNHESVGICLVGGLNDNGWSDDNFTGQQKRMLKFLVKACQGLWPEAMIKGHYHFNEYKDCPCFDINQWLYSEEFTNEVIV